MTAISRVEMDRFASEISRRLGLALDLQRGAAGVASVLQDRLRETSCASVAQYLAWITPAEVSALAERLTVGETYFFRYREQLDALAAALPALAAERKRPLRILSAACSSGEEPGTLAIVVLSTLPDDIARASTILGVDVNPAAIRRARRGRYTEWSLRETPEPLRARWFRTRANEHELDGAARALVSFAEKNLSDPDDDLWAREKYDVVFCRNALMYLTEDAAAAVIARIVRSLAPGGLLFLGPTETHLGRVSGLTARASHGTFYYERAGSSATTSVAAAEPPSRRAPLELDERWADEIREAAERIAALGPRPSVAPAPAGLDVPPPCAVEASPCATAADLTLALDLLGRDRIAEAMAALPSGGDSDPAVQLVRAVLLASSGDHAAAERAAETALALDPLHAGARYLLALCREQAGDGAGAVEHDRAAVYLEPRFAMPHMHLGLLARRRGDLVEAARELRLAVALLGEDDGANIALFGGGLRREVLIDVCRTELRACAGKV